MKYRNIYNLQGGFGSEHDMNLCVRQQNLESVKVTQPLRPVLSCCCMTVWPSSMNSGRPGHVIHSPPPLSPSLTHTRTHNSTTKTIRVPAKLHFSLSGLSMPRQPRPRHGLFHDKKPKPCRSNPFWNKRFVDYYDDVRANTQCYRSEPCCAAGCNGLTF